MPINPNIILSSQMPDYAGRIMDARQQNENNKQRNELLTLQKSQDVRAQETHDVNMQASQRQLQDWELQSMAIGASQLAPLLDKYEQDPGSARQFLANRTREIVARGGDPQDTIEIAGLLNAGEIERAKDLVNATVQMGVQKGFIKPQSELNGFDVQSTRIDDEGNLILVGRNGELRNTGVKTDNPMQVITGPGGTTFGVNRRGGETTEIIGPEEAQRLESEMKASVESALLHVRRQATLAEQATNNDTAFAAYSAARDGLVSALDNTLSGPLVGRAPAVTAAQQIADGARSAMAPVLKSIFRVSGEGVFTDKDQQLLLDMLPDRTDLPEAQKAKIAAVDAIVMAKLNQAKSQQTSSQPTGQQVGRFTIEEAQ